MTAWRVAWLVVFLGCSPGREPVAASPAASPATLALGEGETLATSTDPRARRVVTWQVADRAVVLAPIVRDQHVVLRAYLATSEGSAQQDLTPRVPPGNLANDVHIDPGSNQAVFHIMSMSHEIGEAGRLAHRAWRLAWNPVEQRPFVVHHWACNEAHGTCTMPAWLQ